MEKIILNVLKEDFINSDFISPWQCALALAANRQFDTKNSAEGINCIHIKGEEYTHRQFAYEEYNYLKVKATKAENGSVLLSIPLHHVKAN